MYLWCCLLWGLWMIDFQVIQATVLKFFVWGVVGGPKVDTFHVWGTFREEG